MIRHLRRPTRTVRVGDLAIGGDQPVLIQSMTIADTLDTEAVVEEIARLSEAGCPLVRVTVPHVKAAENLPQIREALLRMGLPVPLVADIHFTPAAAIVAARFCEKVRINPGNYADRKRFAVREYTDAGYAEGLERIRDRFLPLVAKLKERGVALRIGTNHGSLSDRIMNRYGDTPEGMVESALEFVRICESAGYHDIVLSMKSSIPTVMVEANRLLVRRMSAEGMDYPIHLGVTEAGAGLEGRIKSGLAIGSLLMDGIGDTIRVSLTEESVHEIEACRAILRAVERHRPGRADGTDAWPPPYFAARRGTTREIRIGGLAIGGEAPPRVEARIGRTPWDPTGVEPSVAEANSRLRPRDRSAPLQVAEILSILVPPSERPSDAIAPLASFHGAIRAVSPEIPLLLEWDLRSPGEIHALEPLLPYAAVIGARFPGTGRFDPARVALLARLARRTGRPLRFRVEPEGDSIDAGDWPARAAGGAARLAGTASAEGCDAVLFVLAGPGLVAAARAVVRSLDERAETRSIPLFLELPVDPVEAAVVAGALLVDRIGDGVCIPGEAPVPLSGPSGPIPTDPVGLAYAILQGTRQRLTRAEFIACPSCGRTQFDLQTTTMRIEEKTAHLRGVKIAIMGCIVNGPGEMADADFGYVGSAPGRVDLYAGRTRVRQAIPAEEADERLIDLIREHGRWVDPPTA